MRISSHIDVYDPSEDDYRLFIENSMTYVFVSFQPPYLCSSEGHKHGVSMHGLIWLKHFFEYLPHDTLHRPESLRHCLNIHLLFPLWFLTLFVEWFWWWCDSEHRHHAAEKPNNTIKIESRSDKHASANCLLFYRYWSKKSKAGNRAAVVGLNEEQQ